MAMPPTYSAAERSAHDPLLSVVRNHLENQADWKDVTAHPYPEFARPLLTGRPPEPVYIDPDTDPNTTPATAAELRQREWVLPVDLREKWTLRKMAEVFDSMPEDVWGSNKKGERRKRRVLLAVVAEDSTVVYYFVHDGIVKPRQN